MERSLPNTDADGQARPLFRSYPPVDSPGRTFSRLENILDGSHKNSGEILPAITRTMAFRLTARDQRGGLGFDTTHVTVAGTAGPFALITPTTALTWPAFSRQTVAWAVANTAGPPVNCGSVHLRLSIDGGQTFSTVLARNTANDGQETVFIPVNLTTPTARVKVACAGNIFFDISKVNFTLTATETNKIWLPLLLEEPDDLWLSLYSAGIILRRSADLTSPTLFSHALFISQHLPHREPGGVEGRQQTGHCSQNNDHDQPQKCPADRKDVAQWRTE